MALAFSPLRDAQPADLLEWSRRAEAKGFDAVMIPESFNDSLAYAQAIAAATKSGIKSLGTPFCTPYEQARPALHSL